MCIIKRRISIQKLSARHNFIILVGMISLTLVYFTLFDIWNHNQKQVHLSNSNYWGKIGRKKCTGANVFELINKHVQVQVQDALIGRRWRKLVQDFQKITNVPEKLYMYSAYYDEEIKSVKLIGGAKMASLFQFTMRKVYCQFYSGEDDDEPRLLVSRLGFIQNVELVFDDEPYGASFIICPIFPTDCEIPTYVSISVDSANLGLPDNLFHIQYNNLTNDDELETPKLDFALCVQPIFSYEAPLKFLEWIEFYKLMGVQKFTFYNESIGPQTSCLMNRYEEAGQVEVLNWSQVFIPEVDIHVHSQVVQINECLYRYRGKSKYMINVDFDEMIVPAGNAVNFAEMLEEIQNSSISTDKISAFIFRNGFYLNELLSESDDSGEPNFQNGSLESEIYKKLVLSSNVVRSKDLNVRYRRSKYIAVPSLVSEAGVHYLYKSRRGSDIYMVPVEIAYLHHYRFNGNVSRMVDKLDKSRVVDRSGVKFAEEVSKNVASKLREYGELCKIR